MLRNGYAQAQPPSMVVTWPPVSGRARSCSFSCGGTEPVSLASVRQVSPTANPAIRHAPSAEAAETASRSICSSSALSVIRMDSTSNARRLVSWARSKPRSLLCTPADDPFELTVTHHVDQPRRTVDPPTGRRLTQLRSKQPAHLVL